MLPEQAQPQMLPASPSRQTLSARRLSSVPPRAPPRRSLRLLLHPLLLPAVKSSRQLPILLFISAASEAGDHDHRVKLVACGSPQTRRDVTFPFLHIREIRGSYPSCRSIMYIPTLVAHPQPKIHVHIRYSRILNMHRQHWSTCVPRKTYRARIKRISASEDHRG